MARRLDILLVELLLDFLGVLGLLLQVSLPRVLEDRSLLFHLMATPDSVL